MFDYIILHFDFAERSTTDSKRSRTRTSRKNNREGRVNQRENILETTNNMGIITRPVWSLLNKLAPFSDCPSAKITVAKSLERRIINPPSSACLV